MSRVGVGVAFVALAFVPAPAGAQEALEVTSQEDAELQSLVDRFQALEEVVLAEAQARRVARGMEIGLPTTSFTLGLLSVVTRTDQEAEVRAAMAAALPFYEQAVQGGNEEVLSDGTWVAQFYDGDIAADLGFWADGIELVDIRAEDGASRMTERTLELLGDRLRSHLPQAARDWAGGSALMPPGFNAGYTWRFLQRKAVSTGSMAVRSCLAGEAPSCWSVLGFPQTANTLSEWYSEDERRLIALLRSQMVRRSGRLFRRGDGTTDREARQQFLRQVRECRQGITLQCDKMVADLSHRPPLPLIFRTSLVWHALETGGEGAYTRFLNALESQMSIQESLSHAAGKPADELVTSWSARVAMARTPVQDDLGLASLSSVLWMLTLAGLGVRGANRRTV